MVTAFTVSDSSWTKIATIPIETCTSAGVLHHTFYPTCRQDVIIVIATYICISYVTSVRYVAGINHEARGRAAPEGRVIYSGNVPNRGDMT